MVIRKTSILNMKCVLSVFLMLYVFPSLEIPCNSEFGVNIDDGKILPNGAIVKDNVTYVKDNYKVIDGVKIGCICDIKLCIRKCCPLGQYMTNKTCVPTEIPFVIPEKVAPSVDYHFIYGNSCKEKQKRTLLDPLNIPDQEFVLRTDGNLEILHNSPDGNSNFEVEGYCVDYIEEFNASKALVCDNGDDGTLANRIGMIISMPFLLATFIVYAILPDRNLHGKSLMCYVISLFGAYFLLVTIQFYPNYFELKLCRFLGLSYFFLFMGSFFWMNVMSIDIWWTFSGLRGFSGSRKEAEHKKFLLYSCYAWGVPLIFSILVACLTISSSIPMDAWYYPGMGDVKCWFKEQTGAILYFYTPLTIIIIVNITLFCITAWNIRNVQKDTAVFKKSGSKKHHYEKDKQKFNLYLKLMLAMGVNWSTEIISSIIIWQVVGVPEPVWFLTDFCNAIYGMFIFFIFVFKKNIWDLLKKRYYILTGRSHLALSIMQPQASSSSHFQSSVQQKIQLSNLPNNNLTSEGA